MRVVELSHEHVRVGRQAARRPGRRRDRRRAARRLGRSARYGPFVDDEPGPERSLWWWHYNTSKRGVVVDLDQPTATRCSPLVAGADVLLEAEAPGVLDAVGLGWAALSAANPQLVMVSITPFGQSSPRVARAGRPT